MPAAEHAKQPSLDSSFPVETHILEAELRRFECLFDWRGPYCDGTEADVGELLMDASTACFTRDDARTLLTSVIIPRPVAWISTTSADHPLRCNLAPFSSIAPICNKPPLISFSCGRKSDGSRKDTGKNILDTGEFVINFVGPEQLHGIAVSANEYDSDVDEFLLAGVTAEASRLVRPPRVLESLASLECRLHQSIELGDDDCRVDLIIGSIIHAHVRDRFAAYPPSSPEAHKFRGIGALWLDWYIVGAETSFVPQPHCGPTAVPGVPKPGDIADR